MPAVHLQENSKLISGHVAEKKGYLYWVLNLTDENGKRKPKWIPTHKKVKGNKTWANNMLPTIRKEWTEKLLQEATASRFHFQVSESDILLFLMRLQIQKMLSQQLL